MRLMSEAATPPTSTRGGWLGREAVLIPVKAFRDAKVRLAPAMSAPERAALAQKMATRVVASAAGLPVAVVCDDPEVATWARGLGALVIWEPGRGLNGAVHEGVSRLAAAGASLVVVAAGDLPLATDLRWVTRFPGVTIVPDRRGDGTNVIAVPTAAGFSFSYGPGSFARHLDEAGRLALPIRVVRSTHLGWDVDVPDDLAAVNG
jgi:2-phospho-L-lactate guanylyltransferase